jgi:hypothetical protein
MHFRSKNSLDKERIITLYVRCLIMDDCEKRTIPVCFTSEQLKLVEGYARIKGMLNSSQAIEDLILSK